MAKWKLPLSLLSVVLIFVFCSVSMGQTRKPAVAGTFYPADKTVLSSQINKYLANVPYKSLSGDLVALLVPHAGYDYSGQVAAYAYKLLEGRHYDNVIIIGASHHKNFGGIAASGDDYFETPLGQVKVNKDLLASMMKYDKEIFVDNDAHMPEHSIEVQLPFLQTVMKDFKIVPLLFGGMSIDTCIRLAGALQAVCDKKTLVIISTDLSHYHDYETVKTMDATAISAILEVDAKAFLTSISEAKAEACAFPAVTSMLIASPYMGINRVQLINSSNSGDVTPEKKRVVGYASIAFVKKQIILSDSEKKKLLSYSRATLNNIFSGGKVGISLNGEALLTRSGVFVSLKKQGDLRGCIGYIYPFKSLYMAVADDTVLAATKDNRFPPVTKDEVNDIDIEISVLSAMRRVTNTNDIVVGRDGLFIEKSGKAGLLLPQVPVEFGWGRTEFLENLCGKAGLGKDDWKSEEAQIYSFTAELVSDHEPISSNP